MIITLCGSARFEPFFKAWNEALALADHTVFTLTAYPSDKDGKKLWYTPEAKEKLDQSHMRKIEASDAILVINPFAYIGESTLNEINHATRLGKKIFYIESWGQGIGIRLTDSLISRERALSFELQLPTRSPIDTSDFKGYAPGSELFGPAGKQRTQLNAMVKAAYDAKIGDKVSERKGGWKAIVRELLGIVEKMSFYLHEEASTEPYTMPLELRELVDSAKKLLDAPDSDTEQALLELAEVADMYDEREDDDFEVWKDSHEKPIREALKLGNFRRLKAILSASPLSANQAEEAIPLLQQCRIQIEQINDLRAQLHLRRQKELGEIWYWEIDGDNDLDTLTCPVVIPVDTLRKLMADAPADSEVDTAELLNIKARYEYLLDCEVKAAQVYLPDLDIEEWKSKIRAKHDAAVAAEGTAKSHRP